MIRMEVTCFLVIAFMAIMYFSAKRENTKLHKTFSALLVVTMLHLVFDGLTIYTVNQLHSIPLWVNDVLHRLFVGTMISCFYLIYCYITLLVENDSKQRVHTYGHSTVILCVALLCTIFLPITYIETEQGNYSYGPLAYMLYISLAIYLLLVFIILCRFWTQIHTKKKMAISVALIIQLIAMIYQAIFPLALISGMGIMLVNLSFYLIMENPDILLVEEIQKEKRKADEANAAKSIFLSRMSHEIRTPMNAVVGMTEILLRTDLSSEQQEYLINIKNSGNALVSIINDILDISKIEAGKMKLNEDVYEVRSILKDIQMMIQNRIGDKQVKLLYELDEQLPYRLYGDGVRVRQIIINLLNNAIKFTDEGYVKLAVKCEPETEEELLVSVSVSDTGQGIREEDLQRLFNAFEQVDTKKNSGKEGNGLGLSISAELVRMMGGKLEVCSVYGEGSEFFFTIRQKVVSEAVERQDEAAGDSMNFIAPDAKILIVDDNEMNRKVAVGLLAPFQMQIDLADNGKKALNMIQQNRYHVIFMDHMMPIMDGVEATKHLRGMDETYYREVPVIALTANAMKEAEELFKEAGMNGFVAKPIDMRQMCVVLRKWLPENLVIRLEDSGDVKKIIFEPEKCETKELSEIEGLDTKEGIKNSGSVELFMNLLGDFYKLIDAKSNKIESCLAEELIGDYTIEVHALKNTARMIGAVNLSEQFWNLEQLGNVNDLEAIKKETPKVLALYRSYKPILKPYGDKLRTELKEAKIDEIIMYLQGMHEAIEGFDLDAADQAMNELEECRLPDSCQIPMENLRVAVADVAMENILEITEEMIALLKEKS